MRGLKYLILACVLLCVPCVAAAETVLLDFYADWCGPCQSMTATVEQLAQAGYDVRRVNIDANRDLAAKWQVGSIPCYVVVTDGHEVDRVVGVTTAARLQLKLRPPAERRDVKGEPHPAWRYIAPTGHYAATVRILCKITDREACLGSGVLVRWGGRVVVLTAKHVVKDAKEIIVTLATGKKHNARVLVTSDWDCAVLQLDGRVVGVTPAVLATGAEVRFRVNDRFESCGFGGEETKLAANSGLFTSYRRDQAGRDGRDDWLEISGPARQGDSGGPIFNSRGHVVGVLWGTDGSRVIGVQVGRLGVVLNESVKFYKPMSYPEPLAPMVPVVFPGQRNPTPEQRPVPCQPGQCQPGQCQPGPESSFSAEQDSSMLPWRQGVEGKLGKIDANQAQINSKLDALLNQPQAQPPIVSPPPPVSPPAEKPVESEKPGNKLEQKLDDFLHKLPIQGPITKALENKIEDGDALLHSNAARIIGCVLAVIALIVFGVLHLLRTGKGPAADILDKLAAKHPDDAKLQAAAAKADALDAAILAKLGAIGVPGAVHGAAADAQHIAQQVKDHLTALLTPVPGQTPATPPVSVNLAPSK